LKALAIAPDGSWLARDPIWVAHSDVPPIDQLGRPIVWRTRCGSTAVSLRDKEGVIAQ